MTNDQPKTKTRKEIMEADFDPFITREHVPKAEDRIASAVEYAAYQLGQMNRNLAKLVDLLQKREG
jgi:hypothetical protein